jgi:hypothetical protein
MAIGVGGLSSSFRADIPEGTDNDLSGVAVIDELAFGGTPARGVVIGGGIYGSTTPSPTASVGGVDIPTGSVGAGVIGPFVDFYPSPVGGAHVLGAIGVAVLSVSKGDPHIVCAPGSTVNCANLVLPADDYFGTGFGAVSGFGYEGWVGDQWSIGGEARITFVTGTLSPSNDSFRPDLKLTAIVPGALLTFTYH